MKSTILRLFLFAALSFGLYSVSALAQETQDPQGQDKQIQREKPTEPETDKTKAMTVTGCLEKGNVAGQYSIKDDNGKEYDLESTASSVKLADHLNHKVMVTGKMMNEEKDTKQNQNQGHERLDVTHLKMVSTSCR